MTKVEEHMMPLDDINNLDAVVHELGIEDSFTTPADAVRGLKQEIERLRGALVEIIEEVGTSTKANKIASAALNRS